MPGRAGREWACISRQVRRARPDRWARAPTVNAPDLIPQMKRSRSRREPATDRRLKIGAETSGAGRRGCRCLGTPRASASRRSARSKAPRLWLAATSSVQVLVVADLLHPVDVAAVHAFLDSDVAHAVG